jgi:acyl transferase domain-containing protein
MDELMERLARRRDEAEASFAAAPLTRFEPHECLRLAVVADGPDALARKLALASEQAASPHARPALEKHGIFCRQPSPQPPRVVFVFSGLGSQYRGMLHGLVREVPAAAAMLEEVDATMSGWATQASRSCLGADGSLGTDVWRTQVPSSWRTRSCMRRFPAWGPART